MAKPALGTSGSAPLSDIFYLEPRFLTRHGIIAGSTGTGKSRAMQLLAEQLAGDGTTVFVSDVKGDASGFCAPGQDSERNLKAPFRPHAIRTNYWSLSPELARMRFSLADVGHVLLSRLLELNSTQESHLALAFAYARRSGRRLGTVDELLSVLDEMVAHEERGIAKSSVAVIERKLLSLQESGLDAMFGEPSLSLSDLGGMNVLNLSDSRRNMLASIAPAFLLQKLFSELPELGDVEKPAYAVFFDEAHYLFKDANKSLRDLMVTMLKQIRSKGVAVFFVTQDVSDLPDEVLSQLATKIIFAQRVASAKGEADLRSLSRSFPKTGEFDLVEELKSLPPGTAIVTTLDGEGNQSVPKKVSLFAPATSMSVLDYRTLRAATDEELLGKYAKRENAARASAQSRSKTKPETAKTRPETGQEAPASPAKAGAGNSAWDGVFSFLLKLLDFLLKAAGKIVSAVLIKPSQGFVKWMFKKPVRLLVFIILIVLLYLIAVNWQAISAALALLKTP